MDIMVLLVTIGIGAVICGGIGAYVAAQKRRAAAEGFLLGLILGPLGVVVAALLPTGDRPATRPATGTVAEAPPFAERVGVVAILIALAVFVIAYLANYVVG